MDRLVALAVIVCVALHAVEPADPPHPNKEGSEERSGFGVGSPYASAPSKVPYRSFPGHGGSPLDGVECYVCTDCASVSVNTTTKICPRTMDSVKARSCVYYVEKYTNLGREWTVRGCAAERGTCEEIKQSHSQHHNIVTLEDCQQCVGDRCNTNGAPKSLADLTMYFVVLIVTPMVGKIVVS